MISSPNKWHFYNSPSPVGALESAVHTLDIHHCKNNKILQSSDSINLNTMTTTWRRFYHKSSLRMNILISLDFIYPKSTSVFASKTAEIRLYYQINVHLSIFKRIQNQQTRTFWFPHKVPSDAGTDWHDEVFDGLEHHIVVHIVENSPLYRD